MKSLNIIAILTLTLLCSCTLTKTSTGADNLDECIQPLFDIAYPIIPRSNNDATLRQIMPKGNWQKGTNLPLSQNEIGYMYIRAVQNELIFTSTLDKLFVFSLENNIWSSYSVENWDLGRLFVASNGIVWAPVMANSKNMHNQRSYPLLSRFNDSIGNFEFVKDESGLLQAPAVSLVSNIVEDQGEVLWFFVNIDKISLVSFDPKTSQTEIHFQFDDVTTYPTLTVGSDGSLWFTDIFNEQLVNFNPSSGKAQSYNYPVLENLDSSSANFNKANYLYMDKLGKLWMGDFGWLQLSESGSPEWFRLIKPQEFLSDHGLPHSQYMMANQYSVYQSSNELYWFTGENGITRLDPQKGNWCLITTGVSNVVEDENKNLWIAVFGSLYKYALE